MKRSKRLPITLTVLLVFTLATACGADGGSQPELVIQDQERIPDPVISTAAGPQPSSLPAKNDEPSYPLSESGPYHVGIRHMISFIDASRDNREVTLTIWYPAEQPQDTEGVGPTKDAPADVNGAPYPLILGSSKTGMIFGKTLASYGFVVVGINRIDAYLPWDLNLIDQPLDMLFALAQVRAAPPQGFEGLIDFDKVGAMGYSFDGYNALALSGARIDPEYFLNDCSSPPADEPALLAWTRDYQCAVTESWESFAEHAGPGLTASEDGLWQPMTDPGIRAVMPMAPEGMRLFGEAGLAAVDRVVLMIGSENDELYPEDLLIYDHLVRSEKALISFSGQNHMMIFDSEMTARMAHFAVAFFGTQLQGRPELAYYYSAEFVNQQPGLVSGPYLTE